MAMDNAENLSLILVKAGAKRVLKDLVGFHLSIVFPESLIASMKLQKGRQPSFYFVNREEIIKLKEEEVKESQQALG